MNGLGEAPHEFLIKASSTGQYVLDIHVKGQVITYTVNNSGGVSQTLEIHATSAFTSAISLNQSWRNNGATVALKDFNFEGQ